MEKPAPAEAAKAAPAPGWASDAPRSLAAVLLHEAGHVLGLRHVMAASVMAPWYDGRREALAPADPAWKAAAALYGGDGMSVGQQLLRGPPAAADGALALPAKSSVCTIA